MPGDKLRIEIDQLKEDVLSDDWHLADSSAVRLIEIGGDEVINFFISLIAEDNSTIRNRAALALRDIKDNRALEPLLKAIFKKKNHNYNGTMVYALETLDCSAKLKEIFKILFYQTWESKQSAYSILFAQIFTFTDNDILEIKKMWDYIKLHPEKYPNYEEEETRAMMQDTLDGYTGYFKSKIKKHK